MSRQPPYGSAPNPPLPPLSPEVPTAQPDRGAGLALAGFLCSLTSLIAAVLAGIFASGAVAGLTSGEGVLLLVAAFPVALVGLILSVLGRHSTSRRGLAIAGAVLSPIFLVFLFVAVLVIYLSWTSCSPSCL